MSEVYPLSGCVDSSQEARDRMENAGDMPAGDAIITVEVHTDQGQRSSNQDAPICFSLRDGHALVAGIADGMGGYSGGETACALARDEAERFGQEAALTLSFDDEQAIRFLRERLPGVFESAQKRIEETATGNPQLMQMGTTLVLAAVVGHRFCVGNIGDSRAYLITRDGINKLTEDHNVLTDAHRRGQQVPLDTPEQRRFARALTRALRPKTPWSPEMWPSDSVNYTAEDGDVLLLCSDGLHGVVPDATIRELVATSSSLSEAISRLSQEAQARGNADNITLAGICFGAWRGIPSLPATPQPEFATHPTLVSERRPAAISSKRNITLVAAGILVAFVVAVLLLRVLFVEKKPQTTNTPAATTAP